MSGMNMDKLDHLDKASHSRDVGLGDVDQSQEKAQQFQMKLMLLNLEHSTTMAAINAMQTANDKIR